MLLLFIDLLAHAKPIVAATITSSSCAAKHYSNPQSFILNYSQVTKDIKYVWIELQRNVYKMRNKTS